MDDTGLPAYSDTAYSDILLTVTVFGSKLGSPYTKICWLECHLLTVTLFRRPNGVTVSGQNCSLWGNFSSLCSATCGGFRVQPLNSKDTRFSSKYDFGPKILVFFSTQ